MPVNTTLLSDQTTVFSNVSLIAGSSSAGIGPGGWILASQLSATTVQPTATLDLRTTGAIISIATVANASGMTTGQLKLVFAASGISLVYSSGASTYIINSATSGAQA